MKKHRTVRNYCALGRFILSECSGSDQTLGELAKKAGLCQSSLTSIMYGDTVPRTRTLYAIASVLMCDPARLVELSLQPLHSGGNAN